MKFGQILCIQLEILLSKCIVIIIFFFCFYLANDDSCFFDSLSNISSTSLPAESMLPNKNPVKFTSFSFSFSLSVSILFVQFSLSITTQSKFNTVHLVIYGPKVTKYTFERKKCFCLFFVSGQMNGLILQSYAMQ